MHPLREAMLDQMRLRGHSPRTQHSYLNAVSLLSRYYDRSPDRLSRRWVEARQNDLLPVSYYHLVFTLPHDLNGWAQCHPEVIYHRLFRCVWEYGDS